MTHWKYFQGNCTEPNPLRKPPERPPWREFQPSPSDDKAENKDKEYWDKLETIAEKDERAKERGRSFQIPKDEKGKEIVDAVNAAIHLRRPLLITGNPGSGKTSLAYAIAYELQLGPVLVWPVTARSTLKEALYRYDAIARLQDAQLDKIRKEAGKQQELEEGDLGEYIQLGPVGTAFLPSLRPRVLLIDEIDKSDLNLPNDLLNLFEEGLFEIPELVRRKRRNASQEGQNSTVTVRTEDKDMEASIEDGRVQCCEFPIVIMTSNGERDFPRAFYRRCLRLRMPNPTTESLIGIVESHFNRGGASQWAETEDKLKDLIEKDFLEKGNKGDRATDQLLNAIYLITREDGPNEEEIKRLKKLILKPLSEML